MLVAVGVLIGPSVLGIASNPLYGEGAQLIFTLGVSLILFHGGAGIFLWVLSRVGVGLGLLALPGVLITTWFKPIARRAELTVLHLARGLRPSAVTGHAAKRAWRTVAQRGPTPVPSWAVGYALRSPLLAETGDQRTLPLSLSNG